MANSEQQKSFPSPKKRGRPPGKPNKPKPASPQTPLEFWDQQAKAHGPSDIATNPDQHYRKLEIERILTVLGQIPHDSILDVGCGNGYTTHQIAAKFPDAEVAGVDFSKRMIDEAIRHNSLSGNIDYFCGDVLSLSRSNGVSHRQFDVVLSTRTLINLANWQEQKVAILEMRKLLKPQGKLILVENIKEGLANLNAVRAKFNLPAIKERWHNSYIPQDELQKFLAQVNGHLLTQEYVENIGNMYYMASRVIYAKMCQDQGIEPDYDNPINAIASQMPTFGEFYACSPNFMIVLKNEGFNNGAGIAQAGQSLS